MTTFTPPSRPDMYRVLVRRSGPKAAQLATAGPSCRSCCGNAMDGTMNNRPPAPEEGGNLAEALSFTVQPRSLGPLVRTQCVLAAGVDTALLGVRHPGLNPFTDPFALEFRDLHHHAEHQAPAGRLQIDAQRGDDDVHAAIVEILGGIE
jgi:hypothetical protein